MIVLENVSKSFEEKTILENINLEIKKGENLCIVGKSGSGKSVLIKLITQLLTPDEGEIYFEGKPYSELDKNAWNNILSNFGIVFQGAALFDSLNILHNVGIKYFEEKELSQTEIRVKVLEALNNVGLEESVLNKFPSELSGGMKKRVAVARAILYQPEFIFYDEPTTGLDPIFSELIDNLILDISRKYYSTTVVITHDMYSVKEIADRVIMIDNSQIVFNGTKDEFFDSKIPIIKQFIKRSNIQN